MFPRKRNTRSQGNRPAFKDVSNHAAKSAGKYGQPNVTKKNAPPAALQPQRSVGIASRGDVGVSPANAVTNANMNSPTPPPADHPSIAPQAPAGNTEAFAPGNRYQYSGPADDIDERDSDDPLCVTSYVQDMYEQFRSKEASTSVRPVYMEEQQYINERMRSVLVDWLVVHVRRPVYMEEQQYINERMRSVLVDWLVEVHLKFKLVPETLYLTVNIIDRYLAKREVSRPELQLVGVTALLIASKYEEIYPPELRDLVYICDRAYSKLEILGMEENILNELGHQITIPSAHLFLVRYLKAAHADKKIVQLSCFILDGTLQSYNMLHYLPSQLAAAAIFIARRTVGRNAWSPTLLKYAQYREEDIRPVACAVLAEKSDSPIDLSAVNKKYASSRYGRVATISISSDF
eukprot:CAMPEP_0172574314 /NCGR_PEP_ID=MMETSP1067-20121228/136639_1 /TAXON_ID=265564 ORGANISM="Thalassiosira punctigera, Strain Tpunct2005C2" /NCGR_SAMPLE_ID=MMETSP1067 /ASSEMBLY_ACC=CAM_ASM_000444 /LENGTH=404 /DNA_ID=CAMNT_0013366937 /DNA_START=264 /DNA_END=1479 /DNA_ORIENTATION=+